MAIRNSFKTLPGDGKARCDKCFFYLPEGKEGGFCRRYPPPGDGWPNIWADDWCGEYRPSALAVEQAEEHLSIVEAGKRYFGLSHNGSYLAAKRGDLPWVMIGGYKRVPVSAMRHLVPKDGQ